MSALCFGGFIAAKFCKDLFLRPSRYLSGIAGRTCHMSNNPGFFDAARTGFRSGIADLDRKWGWYLLLGSLLVILGAMASAIAITTTMVSVVVLGSILLSAGICLVVLSFVTGNWSGFLLALAAGVLSAVAGIAMLRSPHSGAIAITLMVASILIAVGIFRSVASMVM